MKKIRFISMAALAIALVSFASCGSKGDDNDITEEQKQKALAEMARSYKGDCSVNWTSKTDGKDYRYTTIVPWSLSGNKLTISEIPAEAFSKNLSDDDLAAAISGLEPLSIKADIDIYTLSPIQFLVDPDPLTFNVEYNGAKHKVSIYFANQSLYSFGSFTSTTNTMNLQLIEGAVLLDDSQDISQSKLIEEVSIILKSTTD